MENKNRKNQNHCRYAKQCGGCQYQGIRYKEQLNRKQKYLEGLLGGFAKVLPVIGMEHPEHYRNKVHHGFTKDRSGNIISGPYEAGSHWIIDVDRCLIEDEKCQEIADTIRDLCRKFHVPIYNEKTGNGVMRRVLIRRGFASGEIMVVLVVGGKFTVKKEFARKLKGRHPEITTIISNFNEKRTSMILGEKEEVLFGPGFIRDILCGLTFRISSKSFYQVNPVQTQILYETAMEYAGLSGQETVIDAYCGIGTIGLTAARKLSGAAGTISHGKIIGVELNPDAVRDAKANAAENGVDNIEFHCADAGEYMKKMAATGQHADVVFMDPPRAGSTIQFMKAVLKMQPDRIVYISCGPESLVRNLKFFTENGYQCQRIQPVDMFPYTEHVETCALLTKASVSEA